MKYTLRLLCVLGFFLVLIPLNAQDNRQDRTDREQTERTAERRNNRIPGLGRNALLLNINASVKDENSIVVWNQSESKTTIPGRPVSINLVGSNVVVVVQFTPFIRRETSVLVAQSQIWIEDPERGLGYYTSIQTIPIEFNEPIHFFPLGSSPHMNASIEIIITINPYNATNTSNTENNEQ